MFGGFSQRFFLGPRNSEGKKSQIYLLAGRKVVRTKGWDAQLNWCVNTPRKVHEITISPTSRQLKMICSVSQGWDMLVLWRRAPLKDVFDTPPCSLFFPPPSKCFQLAATSYEFVAFFAHVRLVPKNMIGGTANGGVGEILSQPSQWEAWIWATHMLNPQLSIVPGKNFPCWAQEDHRSKRVEKIPIKSTLSGQACAIVGGFNPFQNISVR